MQAKLLQLLFKHRFNSIVRERNKAIDAQKSIALKLVRTAEHTEFGMQHGFKDIDRLKGFQSQVPLQSYESLEESIQRMLNGEKDVLWAGTPSMFAKSSGTSAAKSKFIPLSNLSLQENHFKGGKHILSIFSHAFPQKNLFQAKNVSVAGSFKINNNNIQVGDLSALLLDNLPVWVQNRRLPEKRNALLLNWEEKIERISNEIVMEDVASLSGVPSWNLILLQRVLQLSKKKNIQEIWPNFQLYIHGGVYFQPYKKAFENVLGDNVIYLETYNASEGFFAIQDTFSENENGMLLLCNHAVFYEFLPLEELNNENPKAKLLHEVELNTPYALIITTASGLWRYLIGDTIKFISLDPFRITIIGRVKYFINLFGEELIEDNANKALQEVCKDLGCEIHEYSVAPIFPDKEGKGGHEWFIEFVSEPNNMDQFQKQLDEKLKEFNSDYEAKRSADLLLQLPKTTILPKGSFYTWLQKKKKMGVQHKVPRLQNNRKLAIELLELIKVR